MKCSKCGLQNADSVVFCTNCGNNLGGVGNLNQGINQQPVQPQQVMQFQNIYDNSTQQVNQNLNNNTQQVNQNLNNNVQTVQSKEPKKKNKKIWLIFVISIIVIVSGLVLLKMFNNDSVQDNDDVGSVENNDTNDVLNYLPGEKYNGKKENVVIATLGAAYVDETIIASALTKYHGKYVSADKIKKSVRVNKNGVPFNTSFVEYESVKRHYSHYTLFELEDYYKSILSGSIKLDGAILVVSVSEGIRVSERFHLQLLNAANVSKIVVYIDTMNYNADQYDVEIVELEIRDVLDEYGFDGENTPVISGSAFRAIDGESAEKNNISKLVSSMDSWIDVNDNNFDNKSITSKKFQAQVYVLSYWDGGNRLSFYNGDDFKITLKNSEANAKITLPEGTELVMPGDTIDFVIDLDETLKFKKGDYIQMFDDDKLVAVGIVTEVLE